MTSTARRQKARSFRTLLLAVSLEPQEIGRRIKAARERKGLTQLKFALEAHVSPGTIQRWEAGKLPRVSELIRVAELLGVTTDELVENEAATDAGEDRLRRVVREELGEVVALLGRIEDRLDGEGSPRREREPA